MIFFMLIYVCILAKQKDVSITTMSIGNFVIILLAALR